MKEKDSNKDRLVFWATICFICIIFVFVGITKNNQGYGEIGKAKQKLIPIAEAFNNTSIIKQYGGYNADVKNNKIIVTYEPTNLKLVYKYKKENDIEKIVNTYSSIQSSYGQIITQGMLDAIYHLKGGTDSIFDSYKYQVFLNTTIENGAKITQDNNTKVEININTNVVNNLSYLNLDSSLINFITINDLSDLQKSSSKYTKVKNTITIHIINKDDNYEIYALDTNENNANNFYNSLLNVIKVLNEETYNDLLSSEYKFDTNTKNSNYEVILNSSLTDSNVFEENSELTKIIIKKETENTEDTEE